MALDEEIKNDPWKYQTKLHYERALAGLVAQDMGDTEEYEQLMEEYLRFCTCGEDA